MQGPRESQTEQGVMFPKLDSSKLKCSSQGEAETEEEMEVVEEEALWYMKKEICIRQERDKKEAHWSEKNDSFK